MTNEEREALIAQGWTPPEVVDPDLVEAEYMYKYGPNNEIAAILAGIKRGRELERAVMGNPIPEQIQEVTPPEPVNPDLLLARKIEACRLGVPPTVSNAILHGAHDGDIEIERTLETIKRGRELERAEAKPGMVWVKHDGSNHCPVNPDSYVWIKRWQPLSVQTAILMAVAVGWHSVTHYAIITPPAEDVA